MAGSYLELNLGEPTTLKWDGLRSSKAPYAFVNDASVTFGVETMAGVPVVNGSGWLAYVAGSDGKYEGLLSAAAELVAGTLYRIVLTATSPTGAGKRTLTAVAKHHGATP